MSARALYRVIVRMIFDPELVSAVYRDPTRALVGADLTEEERGWLVEPDPRAYQTDSVRRARTLTGLIEEFPVASAFIARRGREGAFRSEIPLLDGFFSHPIFHRSVQNGTSMVFAFAEYLELSAHGADGAAPADPRTAPLARLEAAIARLRRVGAEKVVGSIGAARRRPSPGLDGPNGSGRCEDGSSSSSDEDGSSNDGRTVLMAAPWLEVISLPLGTSTLHGRVLKAMKLGNRDPKETLLDPRWSLPVLMDLDLDANEEVLVERPPRPGLGWEKTEVRYATVTLELAELLRAAAPGMTVTRLRETLRQLGSEPAEESGILESLIEEGWLILRDR